jgi:hypothetical protein
MAGPRPCGRATLKGAMWASCACFCRRAARCAERRWLYCDAHRGHQPAPKCPRGHGAVRRARGRRRPRAAGLPWRHAACGGQLPGPWPRRLRGRPARPQCDSPGPFLAPCLLLSALRKPTHFRLCPYAARLQRKERPATAPFSPQAHAAKSSRRRVRVPSRASIRLIYALI